jgi:hypothetical protein
MCRVDDPTYQLLSFVGSMTRPTSLLKWDDMDDEQNSRRDFMKAAGAAAIGGLCGLSHLGCEEDDAGARRPMASGDEAGSTLLEVPEGVFRPTAGGATVHWVPNGAIESRLWAGPSKDALKVIGTVRSSDPVEMEIGGFEGADQVFWRCEHRSTKNDDWSRSPTRAVRTTRKRGDQFKMALYADSHYFRASQSPKRLENIRRCMQAVVKDEPDFCVFIGDEVGIAFDYLTTRPGDVRDESIAFTHWQKWRRFMEPLLASIPSYFVLGNHEAEAGYYQDFNLEGSVFVQRWSTIARKRYYLNPLPTTYPEGGENDGWTDSGVAAKAGAEKAGAERDGAERESRSPLQNYFAWSWGDALFVVLDVHRYTNIGKNTPARPEDWTLGREQSHWLEQVLSKSSARWKFVLSHHLVGGSHWDSSGRDRQPDYAYGRGGARYARIGEQSKITDLMKKHGAQFFVYGHDHIFAHQQAEGVHFVCCGRPTMVPMTWVTAPGFIEAYGDYKDREPHAFIMDVGFTRLTVSPKEVVFEYVKTGMDPGGNENLEANVGDVVQRFAIS